MLRIASDHARHDSSLSLLSLSLPLSRARDEKERKKEDQKYLTVGFSIRVTDT
jgi:hypothetical protein